MVDPGESFGVSLLGIELRQLRQLAAVFEHGSISAAARHLHLRQPTLSRSMRSIERSVGVPLFGRSANGVAPTAYGRALLLYHRAVEANLRNAASELDALRGAPGATIRLGVGPIEGSAIAAEAISRFLVAYPGANISIREGLYATLERALVEGDLDLILGGEPRVVDDAIAHRGMHCELLGRLSPTIVVRASHPLARKRRVTLADLQRAQWIVPYGNPTSRDQFNAAFIDQGLMPPAGSVYAPLSSWTAVGIVGSADVVALLPLQLIRHELATGAFKALSIDRAAFAAQVYLITREATLLSTACRAFLREIRDVCATMGGEIR